MMAEDRIPSDHGGQKKRHHYVPVTYLSKFVDSNGRIFAYRKDDPLRPLHVRPREIAFERYYYSQPLPEGGQDNNSIENFFSMLEERWPFLVEDLIARRGLTDRLELFFEFMGSLRARVPAARDPVELFLAHLVRQTTKRLERQGQLPPLPIGYETLIDDMQISIDPHRSIHAMASILQGFAELLMHLGFEIVHNKTNVDFITSDNPVIYFDPDVSEDKVLPYTIRPPRRRVELLLPVTPRVLIRGTTELPMNGFTNPPPHVEIESVRGVRRVNRFIARFGYRFVFAGTPGLERLVSRHAALSPTIRLDDIPVPNGEMMFAQMIFGPRPKKPPWSRVKP